MNSTITLLTFLPKLYDLHITNAGGGFIGSMAKTRVSGLDPQALEEARMSGMDPQALEEGS